MASDHLPRLQATMVTANAVADSLMGLSVTEAEKLAAPAGRYIEVVSSSDIVSADLDVRRVRVRLDRDVIAWAEPG